MRLLLVYGTQLVDGTIQKEGWPQPWGTLSLHRDSSCVARTATNDHSARTSSVNRLLSKSGTTSAYTYFFITTSWVLFYLTWYWIQSTKIPIILNDIKSTKVAIIVNICKTKKESWILNTRHFVAKEINVKEIHSSFGNLAMQMKTAF